MHLKINKVHYIIHGSWLCKWPKYEEQTGYCLFAQTAAGTPACLHAANRSDMGYFL